MPDTTVNSKLSYTVSYTSRRSIIEKNAVGVRGIHAGVRFGKQRHRLTLAYFWCNTEPNSLIEFDSSPRINLDGYLLKDFHYFNMMFYPYWVNDKRWRFSTPLEVGIGRRSREGVLFFRDVFNTSTNEQDFYPVQMGGYIEFKASRYVGVNFEFGQRFVVSRNIDTKILAGPYYGLGLNVYLRPLWKDVRKLNQ